MKKRNLISGGLAGILLVSLLAGCFRGTAAASAPSKEVVPTIAADGSVSGTFEGTAVGMGGEKNPVRVTITLSEGKLTDVKVEGPGETPGIGSKAIYDFPDKMVSGNTVRIDSISGATITCNAIVDAATAALASAGLKPEDLKAE